MNKYVRLRDSFGAEGAACISCQKWTPFEHSHGGHFIDARHSAIRFDERNVNLQCIRCNFKLHGNQANYYVAMVRKYGQPIVDELMAQQFVEKHYTDEELASIKEEFKEKINAIRRGEPPVIQSNTGLAMSTLFADMAEAGDVHDTRA